MGSNVSAAVVTQKLQRVPFKHCFNSPRSLLNGFNRHFTVAAVFGKDRGHCRAIVALGFKAVWALALVAAERPRPCPYASDSIVCFWVLLAAASHCARLHAIDAFVLYPRQVVGRLLPVEQCAGPPVTKAEKLCSLFTHLREQFVIMHGRAPRASVNPRLRAVTQAQMCERVSAKE